MTPAKILTLALLTAHLTTLQAHAQPKPPPPPQTALNQTNPALYQLYKDHHHYHQALSDYAKTQGFRRPIENLATVTHEIIHIASAVHEGYYIDGTYYEPYLKEGAWPALTNEQIRPYLQSHERSHISNLYANNTPKNHLGNLIDEINAYTHVLPYICQNEPESTEKQIKNITGFLHLTEAYLRTLRTALPAEYLRFSKQKETRGAYTLIMQRAWEALKKCDIKESTIPSQESKYFLSSTPP